MPDIFARFADRALCTTRAGTARDRHHVRARVLHRAIAAANANLAKVGKPPIQSGVTNHTLRRTFASIMYVAGASPSYVMAQMGHSSSALALEVYARMMQRDCDTGARIDALVRGADWAQTGTNGDGDHSAVAAYGTPETQNAAL